MENLKIGSKVENFTFNTPFETGLQFKEIASGKKTALLFLRYYGCTICQYDMLELKKHYGLFASQDAQVLVVLQSDARKLSKKIMQTTYPFRIICDPEKLLYAEFNVLPAKSKLGLVSPKTLSKLAKLKNTDLKHGEYEGNELQLPALFVMDGSQTVLHAHYSKNLADLPSPQELAELMK